MPTKSQIEEVRALAAEAGMFEETRTSKTWKKFREKAHPAFVRDLCDAVLAGMRPEWTSHDDKVMEDLEAMAANRDNGFWPSALAIAALRLIRQGHPASASAATTGPGAAGQRSSPWGEPRDDDYPPETPQPASGPAGAAGPTPRTDAVRKTIEQRRTRQRWWMRTDVDEIFTLAEKLETDLTAAQERIKELEREIAGRDAGFDKSADEKLRNEVRAMQGELRLIRELCQENSIPRRRVIEVVDVALFRSDAALMK